MYTMFPVFSLVLDEDVSSDIALIYPELYKDLGKVSSSFGSNHALYLSSIHSIYVLFQVPFCNTKTMQVFFQLSRKTSCDLKGGLKALGLGGRSTVRYSPGDGERCTKR